MGAGGGGGGSRGGGDWCKWPSGRWKIKSNYKYPSALAGALRAIASNAGAPCCALVAGLDGNGATGANGEDLMSLEAEISELQRENARVESQMLRLKSDINAMENHLSNGEKVLIRILCLFSWNIMILHVRQIEILALMFDAFRFHKT